MKKLFDLPVKVMSVEDWLLFQKNGDELIVSVVQDENLLLTSLVNKRTKEMYLVGERRLNEQ